MTKSTTRNNPNIPKNTDPAHIIEREINGCKVRIFFNPLHNEQTERLVLDNLIQIFERRIQGLAQS